MYLYTDFSFGSMTNFSWARFMNHIHTWLLGMEYTFYPTNEQQQKINRRKNEIQKKN